MIQTDIPFLSLISSRQPTELSRGMLQPSFCMVMQGHKKIQLGEETIHYGPGEYLISTIDMPAAGQIIGATEAAPYLGARIELDTREIAAILIEAKISVPANLKSGLGAFVGKADDELQEAVRKLLRLLDKPRDAAFLADSLKREILYRLLTGENGHLIYRNLVIDRQQLGIGKAIEWLKQNFARHFQIEELAKAANMSVSSLHHKFKAVTAMGPLQYQKQLRLNEARKLLLSGSMDASTAAYQVGYESQSQFSREYRRLFGAPPMQDVKSLRTRMEPDALQI
ncbi:AraC family transcriptional regulator [Undibacterium sp. TJN25]|uniref:AraC family transcriptional regulator n=1 Tax=Undibacterium sp. TJN25 TaxID=3413056 RepID=UPI003BF0950C